jgi:hypothetical protein
VSLVVAILGSVGWTWHRRQVDLQVYLMGAHHVTSPHLYSLFLPGVHLPFTYPPVSTLFFWPLTWFPVGVAGVVWALCNLLALGVVLAVTLLHVRPDARLDGPGVPWAWVLLLLGPAVLLEPVMLDLSFGQINLVLLALVLVDATTHVEVAGRRLPRGWLIGVAGAVKLVPLIFLPFLLLTRQFRAAVTALVSAILCTLAAFVLNPSASAAYWTKYVNDQTRIGTVTYISNQSLEGSLDRLTHHHWSAFAIESVEALAALGGLALAWWAWHRSSTFLAVLIVGDAGLLASPITWAHHMVWVVPVLAWLWWGCDRPRSGRGWALAVATLFYVAPMWIIAHGPQFDAREHGWSLLLGNSFTLAAVVFPLGVALVLWRRRGVPAPVAFPAVAPVGSPSVAPGASPDH